MTGSRYSPFLQAPLTGWLVDVKDASDDALRNLSFESFSVEAARLMCSADGPDGSRYCTDLLRMEPVENEHGLQAVKFFMTEVIEFYPEPERHTVERGPRGPIYSVRLSQERHPHRALLFMPFPQGPEEFSPVTDTLENVIRTVRLLQ